MIASNMEATSQAQFIAGRKRPRKQVRFSESTVEPLHQATSIRTTSPCITSPEERRKEISSCWYNRLELAFFKLDVRSFIRGTNKHDQEARGYERYTQERSLSKKLGIQCTLLAVRNGMKPEEIAEIAKTSSSWSQKEAFRIACQDYCEAYHPNLVKLFAATKSSSAEDTLPKEIEPSLSGKRSLPPPCQEAYRRVRPRAA